MDRELQRLESLTKGPVVSHLTETLSGLSTVRAFGQQRRFLHTMYEHIDAHTTTLLVLNTTNRWLGFALVSSISVFTFCTFQHSSFLSNGRLYSVLGHNFLLH